MQLQPGLRQYATQSNKLKGSAQQVMSSITGISGFQATVNHCYGCTGACWSSTTSPACSWTVPRTTRTEFNRILTVVLHLGPKMHPTNMMQAMSNHPKIVSKPADKIKSTNFSDTPPSATKSKIVRKYKEFAAGRRQSRGRLGTTCPSAWGDNQDNSKFLSTTSPWVYVVINIS